MTRKIIYILFAAVLLTGCRSQKQASDASAYQGDFSALPPAKQYAVVENSFRPWTWAYIPGNISISEPASLSASARLTMQRDSMIHISLRILGMEVAVLYADADSIYAVDKFHKYYIAESLDRIIAGSGLTLGTVQDILLGQALPPAKGRSAWAATLADGTISALDFDLHSDDTTLRCVYPAHEESPAGPVASSVEILGTKNSRKVAASMRMNIGSAKWDAQRPVNFSAPKGYKKIDFDTLLKTLKNL